MRLSNKLWSMYLIMWLSIGVFLGVHLYTRLPFSIYFLVPFLLFGAVGVIPASFGFLWTALNSWKTRSALIVTYALLLASLFFGPSIYRSAFEAPRDAGPYLSWAGDPTTTMTISWTTKEPQRSDVQYRKEEDTDFEEADGAEEPLQYHHLTLNGLTPDTEYTYTVPALGATKHRFHTAPASSEDFAFVVYGDNRPEKGLTRHGAVVRSIMRDDRQANFRFVINTGDLVESPGAGYGWQWHVFLKHIQPIATSRPYLISIGNHEARGTTGPYDRHFDFGTDVWWYSLDYAGVHFVFLSSEHDLGPDSEQFAWLKQDLAARASSSRFNIVCFHRPLRSYHPKESYQRYPAGEHLEPLLEQYGVDIVFSGHVHAYEHLRFGDLHQVTSGGGGVLLWKKPTVGPDTIKTETTFHFCAVSIVGDALRMEAKRLDGSIIDTLELTGGK
jgi:Purple acid Phosphatase, N-terminal domain/Calcineurin-like phosphoesterase